MARSAFLLPDPDLPIEHNSSRRFPVQLVHPPNNTMVTNYCMSRLAANPTIYADARLTFICN